jgi:biofilm PGA synthesis N-glycosyltransferase PgaC
MMTLPALLGDTWGAILAFVFLYPVLMSLFWMLGGIVFYFRFERHPHRIVSQPPERDDYPLIAILVPCYNEE